MRLSTRSIFTVGDLFVANRVDLENFFYRHGYSIAFQGLASGYDGNIHSLLRDLDSGLFAYKDLPPLEAAQQAHKASNEERAQQQSLLVTICQDLMSDFSAGAERVTLERSLELDGLRYSERQLVAVDKAAKEIAKEVDELERLVRAASLTKREDILHHLTLSDQHYLAGRWDDCNSQSRKFLELLVAGVARSVASTRSKTIPARQTSPQSHEYLEFLKTEGLLDAYEEKLISAAYAFIGNRGAHPGRSSQREAAQKRLFASTLARLVFDSFLSLTTGTV